MVLGAIKHALCDNPTNCAEQRERVARDVKPLVRMGRIGRKLKPLAKTDLGKSPIGSGTKSSTRRHIPLVHVTATTETAGKSVEWLPRAVKVTSRDDTVDPKRAFAR